MPSVTIASIQQAVCREYGVSASELLGPSRLRRVVRPRQMAMYLARHMTPRSYPEIASRFGGRHHTTALAALWRVELLIDTDEEFAGRLNAVANRVREQAA